MIKSFERLTVGTWTTVDAEINLKEGSLVVNNGRSATGQRLSSICLVGCGQNMRAIFLGSKVVNFDI